jgi:hypothetical protein
MALQDVMPRRACLARTIFVVFALSAGPSAMAASDCDKATRKALLAALDGAWFHQTGAPKDVSAMEVRVDGSKLTLWTVWLEDDPDGAQWVKGQRTGPNATLTADGPGCRVLTGRIHHGLAARGLVTEDRGEIRIDYQVEGGPPMTLVLRRRDRVPGF